MDSPSLTPQIETGIQHMSECVFVGLCRIVGTSQQVAMRRDLLDVEEMLRNKSGTSDENMMMRSGSTREGFRMKGSDLDSMYWFNNQPVIWDLSQTQLYNVHRKALVLSVSSESPPGFTLLQLLSPRAERSVISALVTINGGDYISSSKYREITCSVITPNSTVHGPCGSGVRGTVEYDDAHCFVCDFWPPSASSWIDRCHTWPQSQIVRDIVRSGCHFVAIGHKLGNHDSNEWRISFSLAEQKLVYSMNHCQFLTYGLLKLFLKEVINNGLGDNEKLLCSYHMKTAVFWMIQRNTIPNWCPQNLLKCFWYCFKLILKWVYEGFCPNFFIPENNMFLSNIHGEAQNRLFVRLFGFYEKGLASLLHSFSLGHCIVNVLFNPSLSEHTLVSEIEFDREMFSEIFRNDTIVSSSDLYHFIKELNTVEQLLVSLQNYWNSMLIPPLVMLHMLEFLCYRHIDTRRAQTALDYLQVLVHHDQGLYVDVLYRDISWQILGICQQISGNLQAALYSYQQSLRQYPLHEIQSATLMRIQELG